MKLLTINTHSLVEENYENKLLTFVGAICIEKPDVIAMQEVNQTVNEKSVCEDNIGGYVRCKPGIKLRQDNHVLRVVNMLKAAGMDYYFTWLPIKLGYDKYDEGLAILSRHPIVDVKDYCISICDDYNNWKTRRILGVKSMNQWFYSIHMGWWNDNDEPFSKQWGKLTECVGENITKGECVWLMGDFNSRADIRDEGYDMVLSSGWYDTYEKAFIRDNGVTVKNNIDGWKKCSDKDSGMDVQMRIDYIWCNYNKRIRSSKVIFNGVNRDIISDHYGVMIEVDN